MLTEQKKRIETDSINLTIDEMELIKKVLLHAYESFRVKGEPYPKEDRVWEMVQYERLKITNQEFLSLDRVLKIIY